MRALEIPIDQGVEYGAELDDISPGALAIARNHFYDPESNVLRRWPGRTLFGTIAAARATGLEYISFRNGTRLLIGSAGTTLATAPVGNTGTFTLRKTLASNAGRMECAYLDPTDRAYWFDGVNTPQVINSAGTCRDMGLLAPTAAPTATLISNSGTAYPAGSTFSYCFTEHDDVNDVESGPSPVAVVSTAAATQTIKLVLPTKRNSAATKFRIYRTQVGGAVFFRLAEVVATTVRYYDGTDSEALSNALDNTDVWGFATFDDIFLATQPVMPMQGSPLESNYITDNGAIPNGDILAVFEESLLVAGVSGFPQHIYYSLPRRPESFSPVYFLREGNPLGGGVLALGVANDRLIAFTPNSISRYDRLPRVTDPSFGRSGASRGEVTEDHGIVGKRALAGYNVGGSSRLLYWSERGPYDTDGYWTRPVGRDLDVTARALNHARLSKIVCKNYPQYRVILCAMSSPGASINDIGWLYHYDPSHVKKSTGVGKWTGPFHLRAAAMALASVPDSENRLFSADDNDSGNVYLEDSGPGDASDYENAAGDINYEWKTGNLPIGGMARHKRVGRVFISHANATDADPELKVAMNKRGTEYAVPLEHVEVSEDETEVLGTSTVDQVKTHTSRGVIDEAGTHIRLHMSELGQADHSVVAVEIEVEDAGMQR